MSLNYSFAGKRVLITGGAQGIGRQLVQRFHDDGALVFTMDKNADMIEQLRKVAKRDSSCGRSF
ncbi:Cis-2,3-dihydrobiphenyl-2,3-diol dehydrogenase [Orchesella cincta]|uniref:Cis-2,3-dihydrobiphenyl-2,3-diol dehydrogenase n=1 Tax=Orchesella cincta TaxID=48709 RepID=A0A1D2M2D5_ORCCI|nr:Cis-2,3-dihydrobiphenyl-2,3-diol dehydrogenase [Orchesella cincta]